MITRSGKDDRPGRLWAFGAVLLILLATVPPQPRTVRIDFVRSLSAENIRWLDVVQNVLLYLPLGMSMAARRFSLPALVAASAGISAATEAVQVAIPGRDPAARDILVNTVGALLGGGLVRSSRYGPRILSHVMACERWLSRSRSADARFAGRLSIAWAAFVSVLVTMTAMLLRPDPLPYGSVAVSSPSLDRAHGPVYIGSNGFRDGYFKGTIDEVRLYDVALTAERIRADMARRVSASAGAPHLVAAYGFDADRGAIVHDDSGRGHRGTASATSWTTNGRFGGALTFDGASSHVMVPDAEALGFRDRMTLEAWVKPSPTPAEEATVISRPGSEYFLYQSWRSGSFIAMAGGRFGGNPRSVEAAGAFRWNEWTHLAATYDGQSFRMYVNGTLVSTATHWSPHRAFNAHLNGLAMHAGDVPDPEAFRRRLKQPLTFEASLSCAHSNGSLAPVFLVAGLHSTPALALNARGSDLFVKPLTLPARLGFASPATRIAGAFAACAGTHRSLQIAGWLQNPRVSLDGASVPVSAPSLGATWAFLIHADLLPAWAETAATCLWVALLAVPIGVWARGTASCAVSSALLAASLFHVPTMYDLRPLAAHELAAAGVGAVVGIVIRMRPGR